MLRGSLCPDGAVLKVSSASPELLSHEGPAVVFEGLHDLAERFEDPDLEIDADTVMVLRNAGPVGAPGMPEWGHLPIPSKLLRAGVMDLLRISDARMSGTSFGTVVLHVAPESAVGGPLALVETGDRIRLDVARRRLDLLVDDDVLAARRAAWSPPSSRGRPRLPPALSRARAPGEPRMRLRLPARPLGRRHRRAHAHLMSVGIGIVGLGNIAKRVAAGMLDAPAAHLAAVMSRDAGKAERFADEHGAAGAYDDLDAFLDDPAVDGVYISTPNALHVPSRRSPRSGRASTCWSRSRWRWT